MIARLHVGKKIMMKKIFLCILMVLVGLLVLSLASRCCARTLSENEYLSLRKKMVAEQIEARGIKDKNVLEAMRKVERHRFVPKDICHLAYGDHPLPIGEGQTISQPYIVALMTEVIRPNRSMRVLEIGTGSGYQAAILAELCKDVYTIEIIEKLGKQAQKILSELYKNVHVKIGDGYKGWPEAAPFDAIIVTCAPVSVPQPLADQLKEEGKMVIPVGKAGMQHLVILTKTKGRLIAREILPVRFVPMVNSKGEKY